MAEFRCTVTSSTGLPIAQAAVRVLTPLNDDVTRYLFGMSPIYTGADGVFSMPGPAVGSLGAVVSAGVYTIVAIAPGYNAAQVDTASNFTGTGTFTLALNVSTGQVGEITLPDSIYVSPMYPVEVTVPAVAETAKWEFIEATVTDSLGRESVIEVQTADGQATLNLQARLELETGLFLVSDDKFADIDPTFSEEYTVSLASLTASGRADLETEFSLFVANAFPLLDTNDLRNFTSLDGLADWLTPWQEVPKFVGHYTDVMIWLPTAELRAQIIAQSYPYKLVTTFFDISRVRMIVAESNLGDTLFSSQRVVRVRIPEPIDGAMYATMQIFQQADAQSKLLNVRYING